MRPLDFLVVDETCKISGGVQLIVEACEVRPGAGLGHIEDGESVSGCASGGLEISLRAIVRLVPCDSGRSFVA